MSRVVIARRAAVYGGGSFVGVGAGFVGLLAAQARLARRWIGEPVADPPSPDGLYLPFEARNQRGHAHIASEHDIRIAMLGDSSAAGLGAETPEQTPPALIARAVAEASGRPVVVSSAAFVGARSADLDQQVDAIIDENLDLAVIMVGANDVTHRVGPRDSVRALSATIQRLQERNIAVVVGTCPDLGTIRPIPHPLRLVCRRWSRALAQAQGEAATAAGGLPVPLGALLGPEFDANPSEFFGPDRFHPSPQGYAAAVNALLPTIYGALDICRARTHA